MKTIKCKIVGTIPLLCHRFTDEARASATEGDRPSHNADRGTPREQCEKSLYLDVKGKPCIPTANILRCLIDAGTFFKSGKSKITTQKSSIVPACVGIPGDLVPIQHEKPWDIDERAVVIPSTGGRISRFRPKFYDWALTFEIELDESLISEKLLRQIVDTAGVRIGQGDFRPARKGPFGRFRVDEWKTANGKA